LYATLLKPHRLKSNRDQNKEESPLAHLKSPRDTSNALSGTFRVMNMRNEGPPLEGEDHSRESGIIHWKDNSVIMEIDSKLSIMRCEIDELHKSKIIDVNESPIIQGGVSHV
jgi:hypothetical protein